MLNNFWQLQDVPRCLDTFQAMFLSSEKFASEASYVFTKYVFLLQKIAFESFFWSKNTFFRERNLIPSQTFLSFKTLLRLSQTCLDTLMDFYRMKLIVMAVNGLSGYAKASLPGVGRTWSWPCLASSSWSAKRFAEPSYLSGTRRTSCLSGTKLPMILG